MLLRLFFVVVKVVCVLWCVCVCVTVCVCVFAVWLLTTTAAGNFRAVRNEREGNKSGPGPFNRGKEPAGLRARHGKLCAIAIFGYIYRYKIYA